MVRLSQSVTSNFWHLILGLHGTVYESSLRASIFVYYRLQESVCKQ